MSPQPSTSAQQAAAGQYATVDQDTLEAVRNLCATDQVNLPAIVSQPPQAGRLKSQPLPYIAISCKLQNRVLAGTAGAWHDYRTVTLTVYGIKADVVAALGAVQGLFNLDTTLTYPSGARFIQWWPDGDAELEEDEKVKAGQDVWKGVVRGRVWSVRNSPRTPTVGFAQFTSPDAAAFRVGLASSFTATVVNADAASMTLAGSLPAGLAFSAGTIYGVPLIGSAGIYHVTLAASNVHGSVIQNLTLTVTNPAYFALSFDGGQQYASASDAAMPFGNGNRLVDFWLRTTYSGDPSLDCFSYGNINGQFFNLGVYSGGYLFYTDGMNDVDSHFIKVNDGAWHHVQVTYDGTTLQILIDGVLGDGATLALDTLRAGELDFGRSFVDAGKGLVCELANISVYGSITADSAHLLGQWQLTEGSGYVAHDTSGNGADASLWNGVPWIADAPPLLTFPAATRH